MTERKWRAVTPPRSRSAEFAQAQPLRLARIPFTQSPLTKSALPVKGGPEKWAGPDTGTHHVVRDFMGRNLVIVHVPTPSGPKPLPFYSHSESNTKAGVKFGDFMPVMGIGKTGWVNKVQGVSSHYGSPVLRGIAEALNSQGFTQQAVPDWHEDQVRTHVNALLKQHWGIEPGHTAGDDDPKVADNVRQVLRTIHPGAVVS